MKTMPSKRKITRQGAARQVSALALSADPQLIEDLVAANRILVNEGVLDAYGHVSIRHPSNPGRYLLSRSLAPILVTADEGAPSKSNSARRHGYQCAASTAQLPFCLPS